MGWTYEQGWSAAGVTYTIVGPEVRHGEGRREVSVRWHIGPIGTLTDEDRARNRRLERLNA